MNTNTCYDVEGPWVHANERKHVWFHFLEVTKLLRPKPGQWLSEARVRRGKERFLRGTAFLQGCEHVLELDGPDGCPYKPNVDKKPLACELLAYEVNDAWIYLNKLLFWSGGIVHRHSAQHEEKNTRNRQSLGSLVHKINFNNVLISI